MVAPSLVQVEDEPARYSTTYFTAELTALQLMLAEVVVTLEVLKEPGEVQGAKVAKVAELLALLPLEQIERTCQL